MMVLHHEKIRFIYWCCILVNTQIRMPRDIKYISENECFFVYFSMFKTQKKITKTKNKAYIKAGTSLPLRAAIIVIG